MRCCSMFVHPCPRAFKKSRKDFLATASTRRCVRHAVVALRTWLSTRNAARGRAGHGRCACQPAPRVLQIALPTFMSNIDSFAKRRPAPASARRGHVGAEHEHPECVMSLACRRIDSQRLIVVLDLCLAHLEALTGTRVGLGDRRVDRTGGATAEHDHSGQQYER